MEPERIFNCPGCDIDWKEGQLTDHEKPQDSWDPQERCPNCNRVLKPADLSDLPMFQKTPP